MFRKSNLYFNFRLLSVIINLFIFYYTMSYNLNNCLLKFSPAFFIVFRFTIVDIIAFYKIHYCKLFVLAVIGFFVYIGWYLTSYLKDLNWWRFFIEDFFVEWKMNDFTIIIFLIFCFFFIKNFILIYWVCFPENFSWDSNKVGLFQFYYLLDVIFTYPLFRWFFIFFHYTHTKKDWNMTFGLNQNLRDFPFFLKIKYFIDSFLILGFFVVTLIVLFYFIHYLLFFKTVWFLAKLFSLFKSKSIFFIFFFYLILIPVAFIITICLVFLFTFLDCIYYDYYLFHMFFNTLFRHESLFILSFVFIKIIYAWRKSTLSYCYHKKHF